MNYTRCQLGLDLGLFRGRREVLHLIGTAGGDHWDGDVIPYMIDQLYVKSGIGAILINAVKVRLPGTKLLAGLYQLQGIHAKAFPAAFEGVLIAAIWRTILEEFFCF